MSKIVTEYDAQVALAQLEREVKASRTLNKPDSKLPYYLIVTVGTAACNYLVNSSGFEAPVIIRTILMTGLLFGVINLVENYYLRRKLDAVIALLLIQEKRRAEGGQD